MSVQNIVSVVGVDTDILFILDKLAAVKKKNLYTGKSKTFATSRTFLLYQPVSAAC